MSSLCQCFLYTECTYVRDSKRKKIASKYLMGMLLTIKNTVLHAQQKKRQKTPFFDQTKLKNKQKNQFQAAFLHVKLSLPSFSKEQKI